MYDSGICFATIPCVSFRGVLELNKVHCTLLAGTGHWGLAVYSVPTPSLTWLAPQSRFTHRGTTSWGSRVAVQSHAVVCPRLECRASAFGSRALGCYPALVHKETSFESFCFLQCVLKMYTHHSSPLTPTSTRITDVYCHTGLVFPSYAMCSHIIKIYEMWIINWYEEVFWGVCRGGVPTANSDYTFWSNKDMEDGRTAGLWEEN